MATVSSNPQTSTITLTPVQIKALDCAVVSPSQASTRHHARADVAVLVEHQLVRWLDPVNFINTPTGIAYHRRIHAIEKLKSIGWQVYPLEYSQLRWWVLATPSNEHGLYESEAAAWNTALESERVQA